MSDLLAEMGLQTGLRFPPGPLTVFVGPNNAGKSLALREVADSLEHSRCRTSAALVKDLQLNAYESFDSFWDEFVAKHGVLEADEGRLVPPQWRLFGQGALLNNGGPLSLRREKLDVHWNNPGWLASIYFQSVFLSLDGRSRLNLTSPRPLESVISPPKNFLSALFRDSAARAELRQAAYRAFGSFVLLDPVTEVGRIGIRLSDREPADDEEEQGLGARSRLLHSQATPIVDLSDGVQAYIGILAPILSSHFRIFTIDEPEAFLHPPLQRRLAKELAAIATDRSAHVFVATHSSHFLMGCLESGVQVNVVRLTYDGQVATSRLLPPSELKTLMFDPLLRSTRTLDALFHRAAIVCEADRDRAFYAEVNHRLSSSGGAQECVFLNAQNKQTVPRIVGPLRRLGIPAAGIVDLDVLKDGGSNWSNQLNAAAIPATLISSWATARVRTKRAFEEAGIDMKREGGLAALEAQDAEAARILLASLEEYGIFVVDKGEVESWLAYLGAPQNKQKWLPEIFNRLGSDPHDDSYVHPREGDVWEFVRRIATWLGNPARRGLPRADHELVNETACV